MSDPRVSTIRCQAWVASLDPPWFLNSILEFNGEGGR